MSKDFQFISHEKPFKRQEGEYTVTRGGAWSGPGCHIGCGVLLYTDQDGKLVKVEGDPEDPFNEGRLCVRCLDLPEVVNHEDRLLYPMKRDPADRGKNKWERISWDEAYDLIEEKFNQFKRESGAESVVFAQGTGRDIIPYITRLCWSFGSPNYTDIFSGIACYVPRIAGMSAMTGEPCWVADCAQQFTDRYENPEYVVPETMFVWGNYPLISNADGFFGHWVIDLMKRGMKIVMIDPKVTWLSSRAVLHLQLRPGTDAALAMGMLRIIINEGLYDGDFVDRWCYGFEELKERVQDFTPEKTAEITWVPEEKIIEAAHILAASKPCTLQWGVAVDMTKESMPAAQAIVALWEITGNMDIPGGVIVGPEIVRFSGGWGWEFLPEGQNEKRIGVDKYPLYNMGFKRCVPDELLKTLKTGNPYKIRGAWFQTTNFLACMAAHPEEVIEPMLDIEFIACVDLFMTPTVMAFADVVLPAATYPERAGLTFVAGVQRAEAINKVTQIGECKSDMQINLELGKRLAPEAYPWDNVEDMFTEMLQATGKTYYEMQEEGPMYLPFEYRKYEKGLFRQDGKPGFNTMTGRLELWSTYFKSGGLDPLPYFEEPTPGPTSTPEKFEEYPFILITGARNWNSFHSEHRQVPRLRAMRPDPIVEVSREACESLGILDKDWVWVENDLGRAKRRVQLVDTLDPRVVSADHGWWKPEADPENLFDVKELCINNLVSWGCGKSGFGANYKTSLCKIYKAEEV